MRSSALRPTAPSTTRSARDTSARRLLASLTLATAILAGCDLGSGAQEAGLSCPGRSAKDLCENSYQACALMHDPCSECAYVSSNIGRCWDACTAARDLAYRPCQRERAFCQEHAPRECWDECGGTGACGEAERCMPIKTQTAQTKLVCQPYQTCQSDGDCLTPASYCSQGTCTIPCNPVDGSGCERADAGSRCSFAWKGVGAKVARGIACFAPRDWPNAPVGASCGWGFDTGCAPGLVCDGAPEQPSATSVWQGSCEKACRVDHDADDCADGRCQPFERLGKFVELAGVSYGRCR